MVMRNFVGLGMIAATALVASGGCTVILDIDQDFKLAKDEGTGGSAGSTSENVSSSSGSGMGGGGAAGSGSAGNGGGGIGGSMATGGGIGGMGGQGGGPICNEGTTEACYSGDDPATQGKGLCHAGTKTCTGGQWGSCLGEVGPANEVCNGSDDDCDGAVDDGNPGGGVSCSTGLLGVCAAGTKVCAGGALACMQNTPAASETCNGLDDNCNGTTDEGVQSIYYDDTDGDGYGNAAKPKLACALLQGWASNALDCDDTKSSVNPVAWEVCNDQIDNDCNDIIDTCACTPGTIQSCNICVAMDPNCVPLHERPPSADCPPDMSCPESPIDPPPDPCCTQWGTGTEACKQDGSGWNWCISEMP